MKKILLGFILLMSCVFAQNKLDIKTIETEQVPDKYKGNAQYLKQSSLLVDGNKNTYPQPYWGTSSPLIYDLDLGSNSDVSEVKIWDYEGGGIVRVWTGYTDNWDLVGQISLANYNVEKSLSINRSTKWIRLEIDGKVSEVTVIGRGGVPPPPTGKQPIISLIEVGSNFSELRLDSLVAESTYNISVNGVELFSFKTEPEPIEPPKPQEPVRVVHISVDGLNSRILKENISNLPTFSKLMKEGAYSFASRTTEGATETVQNHVSMWTGLQMSEHGIDYNSDIKGGWDNSINTIFSTLPDTVKSIGFVAKTKLATFLQAMQADQILNSNDVGNTLALIDQYNKKLHGYYFWHISRLDDVGHSSGWGSSQYLNGLSFVDGEIGKVLNAIDDKTLVIITSDHGGDGKSHGDFNNPENYTIPLFIWGNGVSSIELQDSIYNGATANTAINALGLGSIEGSSIDAICLTCPKPLPPDTTSGSKTTLDKFVGTNVLADDPPELVAPVAGNIRVYQWLKWLQGDVSNANLNAPLKDIKINFNPNDAFGFNHDKSTKAFSDLGLTYITFFESSMYLTGNDKTWLNAVGYKKSEGRNGLDNPNRWKYIAHYYFQAAARYGKTKVDPSKLITDSEKLSGLGYLNIVEGGNEKDRWWIGNDKANLSPEEHAAYYSAIYDGHMNTMQEDGVTFGIKNADPSMQLMLGGLAYVDFDELLETGKLEWFERFFGWFEKNRNKAGYDVYPIDIISFHDYPNTERKQRNLSGKGLDPETYKWYEKHKAFREYLDKRVPSKRLGLVNNEFGYDRNQGSPQRAEPYGGFSAEQVAGFWTVRCMLEAWAAGLDHAAQFYFRDNSANAGGIFASSGLTDKSNGYKPFQMYYYFATMRNAMKGHVFRSRIMEGDIIKYETEHSTTGKKGWIIWHWSKSGKQSPYQIDFNGSVLETRLQDNNLEGIQIDKTAQNGKVSISISEMPTFVTEN